MAYQKILFWCLFIFWYNAVPMHFETIAPKEEFVGPPVNLSTKSEKNSKTTSVKLLPTVTAELSHLFSKDNHVSRNKEVPSTVSYADIPMMEGGGKPIDKETLSKIQSSTYVQSIKSETSTVNTVVGTLENKFESNHGPLKQLLTSEPATDSTFVTVNSTSTKIFPRKGVSFEPNVSVTNSQNNTTTDEEIPVKQVPKINNFIESSNNTVNKSSSALNISTAITNSPTNMSVLENPVNTKDNIISNIPLRKKKPLTTTDTSTDAIESAVIKSRKSSQHDKYVIPVVITILTVPMLIILGLFFYKKGHEFWERRHYRRMDFLIDGMYND